MSGNRGQSGTVTIRDVARLADVHISTVSRALDPKRRELIAPATRQRILAAAEELGYRPHLVASGLRRGQTRTIGVVVPDLTNPVYAPLVRGLAHRLDRDGFMPLVADTEDDRKRLERVLDHLVARRIDALITTAARSGDVDLLQGLIDDGVPVVVAVRTLPGSGIPSVMHDDALGGRLAAQHLVDLGHSQLGELPGPADVEPFRARSEGFAAAVEDAGLDPVVRSPEADRPTMEEGTRIARALLESGPLPTAVFAANDMIALGALAAFREAGVRCPEDVSVVGYNDVFFAAHVHPSLTTIALPIYRMGEAAGALALELIGGEPSGEEPTIEPTLVVRRSTAPRH